MAVSVHLVGIGAGSGPGSGNGPGGVGGSGSGTGLGGVDACVGGMSTSSGFGSGISSGNRSGSGSSIGRGSRSGSGVGGCSSGYGLLGSPITASPRVALKLNHEPAHDVPRGCEVAP